MLEGERSRGGYSRTYASYDSSTRRRLLFARDKHLHSFNTTAMASPRALSSLAHARTAQYVPLCRAAHLPPRAALFSTTARLTATPHGPPPKGFRLPPPIRWYEKKESLLDQAGRYFLLTEMLRGMWVLMEQFFRPPYAALPLPFSRTASVAF